MLRALVPILLVAGCTAVYDAQYTDRVKELEEARVLVVSGEDRVSAITASDHRFFWVSNEKPLDQNLLHSIDQAGTRVDYEFTRGMNDILNGKFTVSDTLVVKCNFGTVVAFSAAAGNQMVDMTSMGSDQCAVNGSDVYFINGRKINRWRPSQGAPVQVVDMDAAGIGTAGVGGFGSFAQNKMLLEEGGKLWLIDLTNGSAVWLENKDDATGAVVFDERGAVFETNKTTSPEYILYNDHSVSFMSDKIGNGGYDLNFEHGDVQKMQTTPIKVWLVNDVLFYRGLHGIFAYRFDTGKVIDVLLDGSEDFDSNPRYAEPVVTLDNVLFVQDNNNASGSSSNHPVYKVDLNARLK